MFTSSQPVAEAKSGKGAADEKHFSETKATTRYNTAVLVFIGGTRDLGQHPAAVNKVRSGWTFIIGVTSVVAQ